MPSSPRLYNRRYGMVQAIFLTPENPYDVQLWLNTFGFSVEVLTTGVLVTKYRLIHAEGRFEMFVPHGMCVVLEANGYVYKFNKYEFDSLYGSVGDQS